MSFIRKIKKGKSIYLVEVESYRKNGKIKQRYIRYVGREADGKRFLSGSIENAQVTKVSVFGPLLVLDEIANQINLRKTLRNYPDEILSMVYSHCIDPKSLNKMKDWFSKTELNHILNLKKLTERKLINAFDSINDEKRIAFLQDGIFESVNNKFNPNKETLFYDVTNIYFYGTKCGIAKRGKNKGGGYRRQVQIGLAVTKEGFPIFHKVFEGNVFDSRTLFDVMKEMKDWKIEHPTFVWDRGVTSKINVKDAKKLGFEVLCGLAKKGKIKEEIDEAIQEDFIKLKNRVQLKNSSFYVLRKEYKYEKVNGYLYICLNRKQRVEMQEDRLKKIEETKELLIKNEQIKSNQIKNIIKEYFDKNKNILVRKIKEKEKYDGYSILFSSKRLPIKETLQKYFEKDVVEKAFASLKGVVKVGKVRKWLAERVRAHVFICYLSYLLLSILKYKLKKQRMSPIEALDKLETMYKVYLYDPKTKNEFVKTVTLTKVQEEILKSVNKKLLKCSV